MSVDVRTSRTLCASNLGLLSFIEEYSRERFGCGVPPLAYPRLDGERQRQLADEHDAAVHRPDDPATRRAYDSFCEETERQFCAVSKMIRCKVWSGKGEPYRNSAEMVEDVRRNARLFVYSFVEMDSHHPLSAHSSSAGRTYNEAFRFIHDLMTHALYGLPFSAWGEEAAYRAHQALYPVEAWPALACETRLQNAWFFFGAHLRDEHGHLRIKGDPNYIPLHLRPYALQKAFAASLLSVLY